MMKPEKDAMRREVGGGWEGRGLTDEVERSEE